MTRNYYFPTINGKPGTYRNDQQIGYGDRYHPIKPERDLRTIKKQIEKTIAWRESQGFALKHQYGYQRIEIPVEE